MLSTRRRPLPDGRLAIVEDGKDIALLVHSKDKSFLVVAEGQEPFDTGTHYIQHALEAWDKYRRSK